MFFCGRIRTVGVHGYSDPEMPAELLVKASWSISEKRSILGERKGATDSADLRMENDKSWTWSFLFQ